MRRNLERGVCRQLPAGSATRAGREAPLLRSGLCAAPRVEVGGDLAGLLDLLDDDVTVGRAAVDDPLHLRDDVTGFDRKPGSVAADLVVLVVGHRDVLGATMNIFG